VHERMAPPAQLGSEYLLDLPITRIPPHTTAIAVVASQLGDLGGLPGGRAGPRSMG
jgi:hypothetical protein